MVAKGYKGLQGITRVYRGLDDLGGSKGLRMLQRV